MTLAIKWFFCYLPAPPTLCFIWIMSQQPPITEPSSNFTFLVLSPPMAQASLTSLRNPERRMQRIRFLHLALISAEKFPPSDGKLYFSDHIHRISPQCMSKIGVCVCKRNKECCAWLEKFDGNICPTLRDSGIRYSPKHQTPTVNTEFWDLT